MSDQAQPAAASADPSPLGLGPRMVDALGGTAVAWLCLLLVDGVWAAHGSPLLSRLMVAGVLGLYALASMVVLVIFGWPLGRLGLRWGFDGQSRRARDVGWALISALAIGPICYLPLRTLSASWLPTDLAEVGRIHHLAGTWQALALAAVGSTGLWRLRGRTGVYPYAVWGALLLTVILTTAADYRAVSNGREWLLLSLAGPCFVLCFVDLGRGRRGRRLLPGGALMLLCVALLFATLHSQPTARAELVRAHPASATLLRWSLTPFDLDGDGYSGLFGGSDCDDANPNVHPAALEFVNNGIDDNCMGGDLAIHRPADPDQVLQPQTPRNVVLVSVDALRPDMLAPPSAPHLDPMPNLRRFAQGAAHFPNAYVQCTNTGHSLQSIMSGSWPMAFNSPKGEWLGGEPSLATRLSQLGYHSMVQNQIWMADPFTGKSMDPKGWAAYRGYAEVDDSLALHNKDFRGKTSAATSERFITHLQQLQARAQPFLAWTHYMDPHAEYLPRSATPFAGSEPLDHYRQEVFATDRALGMLLAYLQASGFFADGVLVLFSDHGELLGNAGRYGHARWVDEEILRGVLLVAGTGVSPGRYETRVRMVDILPTVMELAVGRQVATDGRSLTPVWRRQDSTDRDVFAQNTYGGLDMRVAIHGPHKLVRSAKHAVSSLYDLSRDPHEHHNLVAQQPRVLQALQQLLGERWDRSMNASVLHGRAQREAKDQGRAATH